jgi:hypothetical protein
MSEEKSSRKTGHRFARGNQYGKKGRPKGSRNKTTLAVQALLEGEAEEITRKAIELAKGGDTTALRLVLERLVPPVRERHLNLALPAVGEAKDVIEAIAAVLKSVAAGEITPGEGQAIAGLLGEQRKHIEMRSSARVKGVMVRAKHNAEIPSCGAEGLATV